MASDDADIRLQALWGAVDELLARATLPGILAHSLGPLAAYRLRRLGEPLPARLALEERTATFCMLLAKPLLERVRSSCEGPLLVIKGPEIARLYPGGARRFGDIDVLSEDAADLQRALVGQGMTELHDPLLTPEFHHLQRLQSATGLQVEIHKSPRWLVGSRPPSTREIFDASVPLSLGVTGISTPSPLHHALILAAHAWDHEPLWSLRDLIDIAAISAHADERELDRTAERWGMHRVWRTTHRAVDAAFYGGRKTFPLRTWARHLELVRDRTGFEGHLTRLLSGYGAMPPKYATVRATRVLYNLIAPNPGETWLVKAQRVSRSFQKLRAPEDRSETATPTADRPDSP